MGQPGGGFSMYFSLDKSSAWMKACRISPVLGITLRETAIEISTRSSCWFNTEAKHSYFVHVLGSRLPRATIRYLTLNGFPY